MPILDPKFISNWYTFYDNVNNVYRILEDWNEKQTQDVKPIKMLQGDIGTRLMDVGGIKWTTDIKSKAFIVEQYTAGPAVTDAFDLLVDSFNVVRNPIVNGYSTGPINNYSGLEYIFSGGNININQSGVDVNMTFVSGKPMSYGTQAEIDQFNYTPPFQRIYIPDAYAGSTTLPNFIGRLARFYDIRLGIGSTDINYENSYPIIDADIKFSVELDETFFIGYQSQIPFFGIKGYSIEGTAKIAVNPELYPEWVIDGQSVGSFTAVENNYINQAVTLQIGYPGQPSYKELVLGDQSMRATINRQLSSNSISTVTVDFKTFARATSYVS